MPRIRVLPPNLVNRIAAGECVERPASVVKELVENALDAGASRVQVHIVDGGRELIQVIDDGVGMDAEDLRLAVMPHATSKIREDADLFNIHTMGFRGEALPSIGSVARLRIVSRTRDDDAGYCISVDSGQLEGPTPTAAAPGTCVEVRDLFYCVPARRKFLRTNQTEIGHISEQLVRIALPHSGVAFRLTHGGREVLNLGPTTDRRRRVAECFSGEVAQVLLPVWRETGDLLVEGLAAPPAESRGSSKWEYLFVNGRYVRDRFVSHAVKEAYRSLIDPSRYPVVFLFISIDPGAVDVNVHPTKSEVRWRDSNFIHGQVLATLRDKFLSTNLDHALRGPDEHRERVRAAMIDFFTRTPAAAGGAQGPPAPAFWRTPAVETPGSAGRSPATAVDVQPLAPAAFPSPLVVPPAPEISHPPAAAANVSDAAVLAPVTRALQVHNTYLVAETVDGLVIIDQHALHERILYEELRRRVTQRPLESQRLLLPDIVPVPPDRAEALDAHAETLGLLGIELTAAGPRSVAVQAFPSFLERIDRGPFVRDLLDLLCEAGSRPQRDTLLHRVLDMAACKAAVKAGDPLTAGEIEELLARRDVAERSSHCPHGRPTTLHFSLRELEKQFHRR